MDCLIQAKPQDDPVYQFIDKKRTEGKPYLVYMTAGANKSLRIYYGRVKEYLAKMEQPGTAPEQSTQTRIYTFIQAGIPVAALLFCLFHHLIYYNTAAC